MLRAISIGDRGDDDARLTHVVNATRVVLFGPAEDESAAV
jgi:hypothetical protein